MPTISPSATVLVTGANGYIGRWVVFELLAWGYTVYATVRSAQKAQALSESVSQRYPEKKNYFKPVVMPDITAPRAFNDALKNVNGVIHGASPVSPSTEDPEALIRPPVDGTMSILGSALRSENVKRVVILASIAGIASGTIAPVRVYTEDDWNETAVRIVEKEGSKANGIIKYDASKMLAERAAWEFYEQHKTHVRFDMCTINPSYVFGPVADKTLPSPLVLSVTPLYMYNMLFATLPPTERLPKAVNWVDVCNIALLLVRALEVEEAAGQRIIANSRVSAWEEWLLAARHSEDIPSLGEVESESDTAIKEHHAGTPFFSNEKSKRILSIEYWTILNTLNDVVTDLRSRGWIEGLEE